MLYTFYLRNNAAGRGGKQEGLVLCISIVGIMILQAMTIYKGFSLILLLPLVMIKVNASDEHNYFNWMFQACILCSLNMI